MSRPDRLVLMAVQGVVLGAPLLLGGRAAWTLRLGLPLVLALLFVTIRERARRDEKYRVPGIVALVGFMGLALATTIPLPPGALRMLAPATHDLYAAMLPGWPSAGGWSAWQPLAIHAYGVWVELARFALGFGTFAVILAYPWHSEIWGEDAQSIVFSRLALTMIAGGALLAVVALMQGIAGNGQVLWISGRAPAQSNRASGPFVNPNHFAAWLEMVLPVSLAYTAALAIRVRRRLHTAAETGRRMGVPFRRAWIAAVIANQQRLWAPLAAAAILAITGVAHAATGSRGGTAALIAGLGVTLTALLGRPRTHVHRQARALAPLVLVATLGAGAGALALWGGVDTVAAREATVGVDVSLASRMSVAAQGHDMVREHAMFGTGLGSWLHAFRPYQKPPVAGGIWDHAHNDFLEIAAETGVLGLVFLTLFAIGIVGAARRSQHPARRPEPSDAPDVDHAVLERRPDAFAPAEWQAALDDRGILRCGLLGGCAAIAVHSLVDFSLRMPANLVLLMTMLSLLVMTSRRRAVGSALAVPVLTGMIVLAAVPLGANTLLRGAGAMPLAPGECLTQADLRWAEDGEDGRARAVALVQHALDRSPAHREAHELHATVAGDTNDADAALRRASALSPWAPEVRDRLAHRLWDRGEHEAAATEFEEAMFRFPYLVSHAYLSPLSQALRPQGPDELVRALIDGDTLMLRLRGLPPAVTAAVERGLRRALAGATIGSDRSAIVDDLVMLLEVHGAWANAAAVLQAEAERSADGGRYYGRAAHAYLRAGEREHAERTLLQALLERPEQGALYRELAVEVYGARGEFTTAELVLRAGERNAVDMLPVYRAMTEVLAQREASRRRGLMTTIAHGVTDARK